MSTYDMDSILLSCKKMIGGLDEEDTSFDPDLILLINSEFATLGQIGIGNMFAPYKIEDKTAKWSDLEYKNLEFIKEYMFLRVKLTFDPPSSGTVMDAYRRKADELTWRIQVGAEEYDEREHSSGE